MIRTGVGHGTDCVVVGKREALAPGGFGHRIRGHVERCRYAVCSWYA